jgi:hypothetical protein
MNYEQFIGSEVSFYDGDGKHTIIIKSLLGYGATSYVFSAQDRNGNDHAVKITTGELSSQGFLDEYQTLRKVIDFQEGQGSKINVPLTFRGEIEGHLLEKVIVMEMIPREYQWIAKKLSDPEFLQSSIYLATKQANQLIKTAGELDILNKDVKLENYYWISEQERFIFLDWNRCVSLGSGSFSLNESIGILIRFLYQTLTNTLPPSPLPPVDFQSVNLWADGVPRPIRRLLHMQQQGLLDFQTVDEILTWQINLSNVKKFSDTVETVLINLNNATNLLQAERIECLLDLLEVLTSDQNLQQENSGLIEQLKDEISSLHEAKTSSLFLDVKDQAVKALLQLKPRQAIDLIENYDLRDEKSHSFDWDRFKLLILCSTVLELCEKYELMSSQEVMNIVETFERNNVGLYVSERSDRIDIVKRELKKISEIEGEILRAREVNNLTQLHEKTQNIVDLHSKLEELSKDYSETLKAIIQQQLPQWDYNSLKKEADAADAILSNEKACEQLLQQITFVLNSSMQYPKDEVKLLLNSADIMWRQNPNLFLFDQLNENIEERHYQNALAIAKALDNYPDLTSKVENLVLSEIKQYENRMLYGQQIQEINNILTLLGVFSSEDPIIMDIINRVNFARCASYEDLDSLRICEEKYLEPWQAGPEANHFSITQLREYAEFREQVKNILNDQSQICSSFDQAYALVKNTFNYATSDQTRLQSRIDEASKMIDELDSAQGQLNTILVNINEKLLQTEQLKNDFGDIKVRSSTQESKAGYLPEGDEYQLLLINWMGTFIMQGNLENALVILDNYINKHKDSHDVSILNNWSSNLSRTLNSPDILIVFKRWIQGLTSRNEIQSYEFMRSIIGEDANPIYIFLSQKHTSLFGPITDLDDQYEKLFLDGRFEELDAVLKASELDSITQRNKKKDWKYRLQIVREIEKLQNAEIKDPNLLELLNELAQKFVPSDYLKIVDKRRRITGHY